MASRSRRAELPRLEEVAATAKATKTDTEAGGTAGPAVLVGAVPVPPAVAATLNAASVTITRN
jgi:hypothetical protein